MHRAVTLISDYGFRIAHFLHPKSARRDRKSEIPTAPPTPLLHVALATTLGIVAARYFDVSWTVAWTGTIAAALAWIISWQRGSKSAVVYLWAIAALLGAAWYEVRHAPYANDIAHHASSDGHIVRLRGVVVTDPTTKRIASDEPLHSRPGREQSTLTLGATAILARGQWLTTQGNVQLSVPAQLADVKIADEIEVVGRLEKLLPPANPGEADNRQRHEDQGIRAAAFVKSPAAVERLGEGRWTRDALLGRVRGWGRTLLHERIAAPHADVAAALLLGDPAALASGQLEEYMRTGVFHVLAISGQHLVILCGALGIVLRLAGMSRRTSGWIMAGFVIAYALLTGGRSPVVRAAAIVCTFCGASILRRPVQPLNSLALAWLIVAVINPSDLFQTGCQLSFLSVLMLYQVLSPIRAAMRARQDAIDILLHQIRPYWQQLLIAMRAQLGWAFLTSLLVWVATAPLFVTRYHIVPPVAILLSPFMVMLASIALIGGFLLLALAPFGEILRLPLSWIVHASLVGCDRLVKLGEQVPGGYWYTSGLPEWWLWGFYIAICAGLFWVVFWRFWKPALLCGLVWFAIGLAVPASRPTAGELRCTFLAVGHGSCAVIETPDGRTLLYDAGSLAGPDVTARQIAPFLWSRGISRIDEVFLSHSDLDHFNGLPALLDRFRVDQVTTNPSFGTKSEPGVQFVNDVLVRRQIPTRVLVAGQQLKAGDVEIDVLHPPREGPAGPENARSLVLLMKYREHSILLTGDLEPPGLEQVTRNPVSQRNRVSGLTSVDVVMAPHHGSPSSNRSDFARWARPGLVISSEGRPRGNRPDPYSSQGGTVWRTWQEGAVTVRVDESGVRGETFRTGKRWSNVAARSKETRFLGETGFLMR